MRLPRNAETIVERGDGRPDVKFPSFGHGVRLNAVGHPIMKSLTLAVNTLLMAAFGLAAGLSQFQLNEILAYSDVYSSLPPASSIALDIQWICWAVPLAWLLVSILTFAVFHRDDQRFANAVQLHTSVTLLVGVVMLGFFVMTSIIPFVSLVTG